MSSHHTDTNERSYNRKRPSAREREEAKTPEQKQEDLANLISHTFLCFATDAPSLALSSWVENRVSFNIDKTKPAANFNIDFSSDKKSVGLKEAITSQFNPPDLMRWAFGEGIGDLVAIPATIAVQRHAPEVMGVLEKPLEVAFGGFYRHAAEKNADQWALDNNVSLYSKERHDYKKAHYQKDIERLPQTFVWSAISMAVGAAAQIHIAPKINPDWQGQDTSFLSVLQASLLGKGITALAANAPRVIAPDTSTKADHFVNQHIAKPLTEVFEHVLGKEKLAITDEYVHKPN